MSEQTQGHGVKIVGVSIPFGDLVTLMIKVAIASIPAGIIIGILWFVLTVILGAIFGAWY